MIMSQFATKKGNRSISMENIFFERERSYPIFIHYEKLEEGKSTKTDCEDLYFLKL